MELITVDVTNMNHYIDDQIERAIESLVDQIKQSQMPVFCTLGEACEVLGVSRNKLRDVLYENRDELEEFISYGNKNRPWRITVKKLKKWAEENPNKFK